MKRIAWLVLTILAAACARSTPPAPSEAKLLSVPGGPYVYPRYNEVAFKATHNSYWLNNAPGGDTQGSGVQERLLDQLLHERVRAIEIDLHWDAGHAGEFTVYHTDSGTLDSQCYGLEDCLTLLERFDYLVPNHEPITIILDMKEKDPYRLFGNNGVGGAAKQDHHPQDLDRVLWERLGSRLFTPGELLSRCPGAATLRACVDPKKYPAAWPTIDELRGRYIVTLMGNWADTYWDWIEYANAEGGMAARAAFPIRSMLTSNPNNMRCNATPVSPAYDYGKRLQLSWYDYNPAFELNTSSLCVNGDHPYVFDQLDDPTFQTRLKAARDASVFWQVEDPLFSRKITPPTPQQPPAETLEDFLAAGGVARSFDSPGLDNQLTDLQTFGFQMLMTDYPWNALFDEPPVAGQPFPLRTRANRPFFILDDLTGFNLRGLTEESLTEPGNRLYLSGGGEASVTLPAGDDLWETQPSATMVTHNDDHHDASNAPQPLAAAGGDGCLFARAGNGDELRVCRTATGDAARTVYVGGYAQRGGQRTPFSYKMAQQRYDAGDTGDLLRLRVHTQAGASTVSVWTASTIAADGTPVWNPLPAGDFAFASALSTQGLLATNDMLFVGTRHNGVPAKKSDFTSFPSHPGAVYAYDLSWCLDGACRGPAPASHQHAFTGLDGGAYVGVHEAVGHLFGQDRHLYTTDKYEAQSSGYQQSVTLDDFVLRTDAGAGMVPVYRCIDWSRDNHTFWLSRDPACPFDKGDPGMNGGVIGYLSPTNLAQTAPLLHYRRGIGNDGNYGDNTYDHQYRLGYQIVPPGWDFVEILGFVYTPTSLVTPPCVPRSTCQAGLTCGESDDGCGNTITCGTCSGTSYCSNNRCIQPGTNCKADCMHSHPCDDNSDPVLLKSCLSARAACMTACDCKPQTCAGLGLSCGSVSDGCNHTLDCGGCAAGTACSSGQCVCVPTVTDCTGRCGNVNNGCGVILRCPSCTCTPNCAGKKCGASNGCGGTCFGTCAKAGYYCSDDGTGFKMCSRGD